MPNPVKIYFGSIIKDNKISVVVPVEELSSGWQSGNVLFTFTNEYCTTLDELSFNYRSELDIAQSNVEESDVDSESEDDSVQQSVIHIYGTKEKSREKSRWSSHDIVPRYLQSTYVQPDDRHVEHQI